MMFCDLDRRLFTLWHFSRKDFVKVCITDKYDIEGQEQEILR